MSLKFVSLLSVAVTFSLPQPVCAFGPSGADEPRFSFQISDIQTSNRMVVRLLDRFNANDSASIRSLATDQFSSGVPEEMFRGMVQQIHSVGTLSNPELVLDLVEQRHYRLTAKQVGQPDRKIVMIIGVESSKKYFNLGFERYVEPIARAKPFATDNRKKTTAAAAVQFAIDRYVKQFKPVGISIGVFSEGKESFYNYGEVKAGTNHLPTSHSIY